MLSCSGLVSKGSDDAAALAIVGSGSSKPPGQFEAIFHRVRPLCRTFGYESLSRGFEVTFSRLLKLIQRPRASTS